MLHPMNQQTSAAALEAVGKVLRNLFSMSMLRAA